MGRLAGSSTAALRIRPAQIGDANDVAVLLGELGYPCTHEEAVERISRVLHDPRLFLLLAEMDGVACGLMAMDIRYSITRGADLARITALVVAANLSRQGNWAPAAAGSRGDRAAGAGGTDRGHQQRPPRNRARVLSGLRL